MVRPVLFVGLVLLAGCARSEEAGMVTDTNNLQVEQVRAPERDDEVMALGQWREVLQGDRAALEFGPEGVAPLFSLHCDPRRSIALQRHGVAPSGDLPMMLVSIGSETRRLAVTAAGGTVPMLRATVAPSDTLLGTLASTSVPIAIRIGDAAPMVLPPDPSIGTFIAACESGPRTASEAGNEVAANESSDANQATPAPVPAPAQR